MRRPATARHARSTSRERGSATVELTFILPIVLLIVFGLMQGALVAQGRATAIAAAQEGARVAAGERGTVDMGIAAAKDFVEASSLGSPAKSVSGTRTVTEATIVVTVKTTSVIPAWRPTIVKSASMPVERVTG
ncbi:TadE/TadG family type IV pilus assembly protein [Promicromonospora sp. Marseille-Q5078]